MRKTGHATIFTSARIEVNNLQSYVPKHTLAHTIAHAEPCTVKVHSGYKDIIWNEIICEKNLKTNLNTAT